MLTRSPCSFNVLYNPCVPVVAYGSLTLTTQLFGIPNHFKHGCIPFPILVLNEFNKHRQWNWTTKF
jgi:uncharacterized membrane protein YhdT